jgi:hypothetical protein
VRKWTRPGLLLLNLALLAGLVAAVLGPGRVEPAWAQGAGAGGGAAPGRARGDYLLLTGRAQGLTSDVAYVLDTANRELIALRWDRSRRELSLIGWRSVGDDAGAGAGGAGGAGNAPPTRSGGANR